MGDGPLGSPASPGEPPVGPDDDGGVASEHAAREPDAAGEPAQGKEPIWMHILTRQASPPGRTHDEGGAWDNDTWEDTMAHLMDILKIRNEHIEKNPTDVETDAT